MPTDVIVPPLGQTVDTLTFVSWYKQEGEAVRAGEPLFVVETDKATLDVEAPAGGVLRQVTARPGDEVAVLSVIAVIAGKAEGDLEEFGGAHGSSEELRGNQDVSGAGEGPAQASGVQPSSPPRLLASPRARRLADRAGVPLQDVSPTGPEGAIVERDVRAYLGARGAEGEPAEPAITPVARRMAEEAGLDWHRLRGSGPAGRIVRGDVDRALTGTAPPAPATAAPGLAPADLLDTIPLRSVRAVIAQRMLQSHRETAPVTLTAEADAGRLVALRQDLRSRDLDVSYNDLLLAILARCLQEHPRLNASLVDDQIHLWRRVDIGLAVDTERGLLVPVVRDVAAQGLRQLARQTRLLAERARSGQLTPDELQGGTFTLTNLGMYGIDAFTPLVNLPETAILGVGRIKEQAVWVRDHVEGRPTVWLSLTFDHRLVDGGPAARFLQAVVRYVEEPHLLLA